MDSVKNAANYLSETAKGTGHAASEEANKKVAQDSNAPMGDRLKSAGNAAADKAKGQKAEASAEANKQGVTR